MLERQTNIHRKHKKYQPIPVLPQNKTEFDVGNYTYTEPEDKYANELEYARSGKDQGIVIIFNQVFFDDDEARIGSTVDVENITLTMGRLGYNINKKYIFSSLTTEEINEKLNNILQEDLSDKNCLILFFLTHGAQDDILVTKDGTVKSEHIWSTLSNHEDLKNKPKLCVFQACKGYSKSIPFRKLNDTGSHKISSISINASSLPSDLLLCYSSAEGMMSYRHPDKGTWFIQEVCRNFMAYGRRDDVTSLFTRVAKCVSTYEHLETKQMPVMISTLSRKFYLTKRKDRTNILASVELYNKIVQYTHELESLLVEDLNNGETD